MTARKQVWTHILLLSVVSVTLGIMGAVTWNKRRVEQEKEAALKAQRELDELLTGQIEIDGTSGADVLVEWPHTIDLLGYAGPAGATLALGDRVIAFVSSQGVVTLPGDGEDEGEAWLLDECPRCEGNILGARGGQ